MFHPTTLIQARQLYSGYRDETVLHDLSFELIRGQTSLVLGPGGSGKTTLLRILSSPPRKNSDLWQKGYLQKPARSTTYQAQKTMPRASSLSDYLRGAIAAGTGRAAGVPTGEGGEAPGVDLWLQDFWRDVPAAADAFLSALDRPVDQLTPSLSRLAVFTAAAGEQRDVLLLDEPDFGLDDNAREWLVSKLVELRGSRTIVLVTHNLKIARAVGDFAMLLVEGRLLEASSVEDFFDRPRHPRTRDFVRWGS